MSWAEEQSWFGTEDMIIDAEYVDPKEEIERGRWIQKNWEAIELKAMTDKHLNNSINMIKNGRLARKWALPYLLFEKERRKQLS